MVNLKSVTVTHKNGTTALKRVSLRIDDGEFVLINGHSGAGKSTIVRLLTAEDGAFHPEQKVTKYRVIRVWKQAAAPQQ